MTIAERLGEIDLSTKRAAPKGTASLQTDHFAVLLVQGLESNDANILNVSRPAGGVDVRCCIGAHPSPTVSSPLSQKVFQTHKDVVIKKTVALLPLPAVLPLLEEVRPVFVNDGRNFCFLFFFISMSLGP